MTHSKSDHISMWIPAIKFEDGMYLNSEYWFDIKYK